MLKELTKIVKTRPLTLVTGNSLEYGFLQRSIKRIVSTLPDLSIDVVEDLPGQSNIETQTILRSKYHEIAGTSSRIIYLAARDDFEIDHSISRMVKSYRMPSPTELDIQALYLEKGVTDITHRTISLARGISFAELSFALDEAKYADDFWGHIDATRKEKLEIIGLKHEPAPDIPDVAGLDKLMALLPRIKAGFSDAARKAGLKFPKGFLIAGVPGTGKTLAARVIAAKLGLPIISLGVDLVCDRGVKPLKEMLAKAEECSPCVLYIDELDKFFNGDSQKQILGYLLTWLNDRTTPVFVIATLNRLDNVPAELMRAGRWNGTYSVTMPDHNELVALFKLLLAQRDTRYLDPAFISEADWQILTDNAVNCVGAEVAEIVERVATTMVMEGKPLPLRIDFSSIVEEARNFKRQYARSYKAIDQMSAQIEGVCDPAGGAETVILDNTVDYN